MTNLIYSHARPACQAVCLGGAAGVMMLDHSLIRELNESEKREALIKAQGQIDRWRKFEVENSLPVTTRELEIREKVDVATAIKQEEIRSKLAELILEKLNESEENDADE